MSRTKENKDGAELLPDELNCFDDDINFVEYSKDEHNVERWMVFFEDDFSSREKFEDSLPENWLAYNWYTSKPKGTSLLLTLKFRLLRREHDVVELRKNPSDHVREMKELNE